MPGRTDVRRSPSGFTLLEVVITLLILGMVGLMVNGVLVRLAQTNVAASNVAERLPVAGTAIGLVKQRLISSEKRLSDDALKKLIKSPAATAAEQNYQYVYDDSGRRADLLPADWLKERPSVSLSEGHVPDIPAEGIPEGISFPPSLEGASWYEVKLTVVLDPGMELASEFRLSVEGVQQ